MKGASSLSGLCHTWDAKADGYIKAEGINAVMLKRLEDAVRDGDPIRAVIRGTATNSDGYTPGIASPNSEAQAAAIRAAYAHAGITNFEDTTYLECHGTGTAAGDPTELNGAASVFAAKPRKTPLLIGSIKSNIGHSEPAAGISGLLKAILTLEHDFIPGNPTFIDPSPKIDFQALQVEASRVARPWPNVAIKRASVNSFGYGGSNFHCVVDAYNKPSHKSSYRAPENFDDFFDDAPASQVAERPHTLVFSANDEASLRSWVASLSGHLMNPEVSVQLSDLAFTLSERRSRLFHRGYLLANTVNGGLDTSGLIVGKPGTEAPRVSSTMSTTWTARILTLHDRLVSFSQAKVPNGPKWASSYWKPSQRLVLLLSVWTKCSKAHQTLLHGRYTGSLQKLAVPKPSVVQSFPSP